MDCHAKLFFQKTVENSTISAKRLTQRWVKARLFILPKETVVMNLVEKVTAIIEPSLEAMGYDVVLVKLADGARRKTLTIMAERKDGKGMSFDDCGDISHTVGALLEVQDPISGAYNLEVCSPGIDRPLTRLKDFVRFTGAEVKLETHVPVSGRKRFRGLITVVKNDTITLSIPEGNFDITFGNIRTAKLSVPAEPLPLKKGTKK